MSSGSVLRDLGRHDDALTTYGQMTKRDGLAEEPELARYASWALTLEADVLEELDRSDEANLMYDALIDRYRTHGDEHVRRRVANAVLNKSVNLSKRGDVEQALDATRQMPSFENGADAKLREIVVRALGNEGFFLATLGRSAEAESVYDRIVSLPVDLDQDRLVEDVLRACVNRYELLHLLGRSDEALEGLRQIVARFDDVQGEHARIQLASANAVYANALEEAGRPRDALAAHARVGALSEGFNALSTRGWVVSVRIAQAKVHLELGEFAEAAELYRSIFDRAAGSADEQEARTAAWAGVQAMRMFHRARRPVDVVETARAVRSRYAGSGDPYLRARVRNVWTVATVMPYAMHAIDSVERHPRRYAVVAATASAAAVAAWARRRAARS